MGLLMTAFVFPRRRLHDAVQRHGRSTEKTLCAIAGTAATMAFMGAVSSYALMLQSARGPGHRRGPAIRRRDRDRPALVSEGERSLANAF
jgi:hypothetical protein